MCFCFVLCLEKGFGIEYVVWWRWIFDFFNICNIGNVRIYFFVSFWSLLNEILYNYLIRLDFVRKKNGFIFGDNVFDSLRCYMVKDVI